MAAAEDGIVTRLAALPSAVWTRIGEVVNRTFVLPMAIFFPTSRCNSRCVSCEWWKSDGADDLSFFIPEGDAVGDDGGGIKLLLLVDLFLAGLKDDMQPCVGNDLDGLAADYVHGFQAGDAFRRPIEDGHEARTVDGDHPVMSRIQYYLDLLLGYGSHGKRDSDDAVTA